MAFASGGTLGTGANSSSNSSYTFNTATNSLASGDFGILVNVSDNTSTTDGNNNEHTSVSGGTGTWTKLGEHTNSEGSAGAGVTTSVWLFEASGTVNTGTTITLNFTSNRTDKTCSFWRFTKASGASVAKDAEPGTNPVVNALDASNGFGSVSFSSLSSKHRLYFRGLGKEPGTTTGSTTQITESSNFTAITNQRSRNNAACVLVRGEFRINTSTGETSNPTLAVGGDSAGVFLALVESYPDIAGSISATETGSDAAALTGSARVSGAIAGAESGSDVAEIVGQLQGNEVTGELSATETGSDVGAVSGAVLIFGALAAAETGADLAAFTGAVPVAGYLSATEAGPDAASFAGAVLVSGSLAATEQGQDQLAIAGEVPLAGQLAAVESGADALAVSGVTLIFGSLAGAESGGDAAELAGSVSFVGRTGYLAAAEGGADAAAIAGDVLVTGALSVGEAGQDTATIVGYDPGAERSGALAASESGADAASLIGRATRSRRVRGGSGGSRVLYAPKLYKPQPQLQLVTGAVAAMESGADGCGMSGRVAVRGLAAAVEAGSDGCVVRLAVSPPWPEVRRAVSRLLMDVAA